MTGSTTGGVKQFDVDDVLIQLGEFGKYQIIVYVLICIPLFFLGGFVFTFVFTAGNLEYRCKIPECDKEFPLEYNVTWFSNAIPVSNGKFSKCSYYSLSDSNKTVDDDQQCLLPESFNTSNQVQCNEFIYKTNERTIVNEFNLTCEENQWKLAMVGTVNNIAQFLFTPIAGYLSDRYGRRCIFVYGIVFGGVFGVIKSFSVNYFMFLSMEFLEAGVTAATYSALFIIGMEILAPNKRVLGGTIMSVAYALGGGFLGLVASYITNFRTILQIFYAPALFYITYLWLIPESIRWLLVKNRKDEVLKIILRAAKLNNVILSKSTLNLMTHSKSSSINKTEEEMMLSDSINIQIQQTKIANDEQHLFEALKSPFLLIRLVNCCLCWLTNTLVYYGLSLSSVALSGGSKYVNFILSSLIEIPGFIMSYYLLNKLGRRWSLSGSLFVSGVSCILSQFFDNATISLIIFLIGKCAITISFNVLYIYTAELYPTYLRHTLLSFCSMIGRIGSMIAPQTPLLANIMPALPFILYGSIAIITSICTLQFPETLNEKLPDTMEDARNLGKKTKNKIVADIEKL